MSSSTVRTVAAFALLELITLVALFCVHQKAETELNNQLKVEALDAQSKVVASRMRDFSAVLHSTAVFKGTSSDTSVALSIAELTAIFEDIKQMVRKDRIAQNDLVRFERVTKQLDQFAVAAQADINEPCQETLRSGVRPFYSKLPAMECELIGIIGALRNHYRQPLDTLFGAAISWRNLFGDLTVCLLGGHCITAVFLLFQRSIYVQRDFDSGGTAGGVVLSSLGWLSSSPWRVNQQSFISFVAVSLEAVLFGLILLLSEAAIGEATELHRAQLLVGQVDALRRSFYQSGVAMGGYSITKSWIFGERYESVSREIPDQVRRLKVLTSGSLKQTELVQAIEADTLSGLKILREARIAIDDDRIYSCGGFRCHHRYKAIRILADKLQDESAELTVNERALLKESPASQHRIRTSFENCIEVLLLLHLGLSALCFAGMFKGRLR